MDQNDVEPLRAILHRALVRYLTVTPRGFVLVDEPSAVPIVQARILGYGGARTLYRKRKPACRSLDGVLAVSDPAKRCAECPDRGECTPQVRVDLIVRRRAYRLLLAFTSARNFLEHVARLQATGVAVEQIEHEIRVLPRGSWGELRFRSRS